MEWIQRIGWLKSWPKRWSNELDRGWGRKEVATGFRWWGKRSQQCFLTQKFCMRGSRTWRLVKDVTVWTSAWELVRTFRWLNRWSRADGFWIDFPPLQIHDKALLRSHVRRIGSWMGKPFGTVVTNKRFFSWMNSYVFFEVVFEFERFSTFRTLEFAQDLGFIAAYCWSLFGFVSKGKNIRILIWSRKQQGSCLPEPKWQSEPADVFQADRPEWMMHYIWNTETSDQEDGQNWAEKNWSYDAKVRQQHECLQCALPALSWIPDHGTVCHSEDIGPDQSLLWSEDERKGKKKDGTSEWRAEEREKWWRCL